MNRDSLDLVGATAVVTGAASGIGLALALVLASEGAHVVMVDVQSDELGRAVIDVGSSARSRVLGRTVDVSSRKDVSELADWVVDEVGPVRVLFNNAGVDGYRGGSLWDASKDDWAWTMGVNFWGVVHGVEHFLPRMLEGDARSHIVNTASAAALMKPTNMYGVTKHAVLAYTESVHSQLLELGDAAQHVGITALLPDRVATPFFSRVLRRDAGPAAARDVALGAEIRAERHRRLSELGAAPEAVARRALLAVQGKELYALTHPTTKDRLRQRAGDLARPQPHIVGCRLPAVDSG